MHPRTLAIVASVVVLLTIALGVLSTGGPTYQRALRMDETRLQRLTSIQTEITQYYQEKNQLPATLDVLYAYATEKTHNQFQHQTLKDPETATPFEYKVTAPNRYELCATLQTDTQDLKDNDPSFDRFDYSYNSQFRVHPKGYHCYPNEVKPIKQYSH